MKLRIKGNSLRLRVSRFELAHLQAGDRIEETIRFAEAPEAKLTYALESAAQSSPLRVRYGFHDISVILSEHQVCIWKAESKAGVYSKLDIGSAVLSMSSWRRTSPVSSAVTRKTETPSQILTPEISVEGRQSEGPSEGPIEDPLTVLAGLRRQGLIRYLGPGQPYT